MTRVLILGGSGEATALAHRLSAWTDIEATLSLAGRTATPMPQPIATRTGGFGGVDGLAQYLRDACIDILVDATHPFAAQMAAQARAAAGHAGCRLLKVSRPPWHAAPGDCWLEVSNMAEAAAALGETPRRVFLTVGSLQLAPFAAMTQHLYLIRTIDPVGMDHGFAHATFIAGRGPFDVMAEERLLRDHRIEMIVTKNSGGEATAAKLEAARRLALTVVLVRRPHDVASRTVDEALAVIAAHRAAVPRGV